MGNTSGGTSFSVHDGNTKPTELPTTPDEPPEKSEYGPGMDNWFMRRAPERNNHSNNPLTGLPKMPLRSFSNQGPTQYTNDRANDNLETVYYKPVPPASDLSDKENDKLQDVSVTDPVVIKSHKRNNSVDTDVTLLTTATPMSVAGKRKKNPAPPPPGNRSNASFTSERKSSVGSLGTLESSAETAPGVRKKKRRAPPPPVPLAPPSVIVEEPSKRDSTGSNTGHVNADAEIQSDEPLPVNPTAIVMAPPPPPPPPPPVPPPLVQSAEVMQTEEEETMSPLTAALRSAVNEREKRIKQSEKEVVTSPVVDNIPPPPELPPPPPLDGVPGTVKELPKPAAVFSDELKGRVHDRELRRERGDLKLPERTLPFSKVFNMELRKAYLDRTQRREHGELKMRVAPSDESETEAVALKNNETGEVATRMAPTDWVPDQDLEGDNLDGPDVHAEITARGKTIPDAMYMFSRHPQRPEGDKHKRMSKMKRSIRNALGSIGRGFTKSQRSKLHRGKSKMFDDDEWEIFPAQEYDEPPNEPIEIHRIEKHPAYAYNARKGQLVLLPNHEDVIVTTDGKYIKESDLSKVQRRKKSHSRKYTKRGGMVSKDIQRKELRIEEERNKQRMAEAQFKIVRQKADKNYDQDLWDRILTRAQLSVPVTDNPAAAEAEEPEVMSDTQEDGEEIQEDDIGEKRTAYSDNDIPLLAEPKSLPKRKGSRRFKKNKSMSKTSLAMHLRRKRMLQRGKHLGDNNVYDSSDEESSASGFEDNSELGLPQRGSLQDSGHPVDLSYTPETSNTPQPTFIHVGGYPPTVWGYGNAGPMPNLQHVPFGMPPFTSTPNAGSSMMGSHWAGFYGNYDSSYTAYQPQPVVAVNVQQTGLVHPTNTAPADENNNGEMMPAQQRAQTEEDSGVLSPENPATDAPVESVEDKMPWQKQLVIGPVGYRPVKFDPFAKTSVTMPARNDPQAVSRPAE